MSSRLVVIPRFFYGKKLNGKETKHLDGNLIGISLDNIMYIYVIYHRYNQLRLYIYIYIFELCLQLEPQNALVDHHVPLRPASRAPAGFARHAARGRYA